MNKDIKRMLEDIEAEVRFTRDMIGRQRLGPEVMEAMAKVPRDKFVPDGVKAFAYDNGPLSIGHSQTISQPYIVALMTDLLQPKADHKVLEIGTGSGYQTAVLSQLVDRVYTVELEAALSESARQHLEELGYDNIEFRVGNGYEGWPEHAPYDGILVTAAAPFIPEPLIEQLKPGGHLVIPVGEPHLPQNLMLVTKDQQGKTRIEEILAVAFVPLRQNAGD